VKVFLSDGARHTRSQGGYGQLAAALIAHLPVFGIDVSLDPDASCAACLYVCPPSGMHPDSVSVPTAAFTMHELETLPDQKAHWVDILNQVNLVITPTAWNERVWRRVGVETRIAVVPLGVEPADYFPAKDPRFTILTAHENLGGGSSRENWRDTLVAYYSAFSATDPVELRVKTWNWKPDGFAAARREVIRGLGLEPEVVPPVEVIGRELGVAEMRQEYQRCWLFLKNANREGWGLPATEAAACGAGLAATRIEPLVSHLDAELTSWFEPGDTDALTDIFRRGLSDYRAEVERMERFTWRRTASGVAEALLTLLPEHRAGENDE
jgi:hypothetical protein